MAPFPPLLVVGVCAYAYVRAFVPVSCGCRRCFSRAGWGQEPYVAAERGVFGIVLGVGFSADRLLSFVRGCMYVILV